MPIDFSKPVKTVSGLGVTILETACPGDKPVVGRFTDAQGTWIFRWLHSGKLGYTPSDFDLVQAPETLRLERWLNIYKDVDGGLYFAGHSSASSARQVHDKLLYARKHLVLDVVEGEGL